MKIYLSDVIDLFAEDATIKVDGVDGKTVLAKEIELTDKDYFLSVIDQKNNSLYSMKINKYNCVYGKSVYKKDVDLNKITYDKNLHEYMVNGRIINPVKKSSFDSDIAYQNLLLNRFGDKYATDLTKYLDKQIFDIYNKKCFTMIDLVQADNLQIEKIVKKVNSLKEQLKAAENFKKNQPTL